MALDNKVLLNYINITTTPFNFHDATVNSFETMLWGWAFIKLVIFESSSEMQLKQMRTYMPS